MTWLTLLAHLPPAHWPEATRRLLATPNLHAHLCQPTLAEHLAPALTDLAAFTPARLVQAAYSATHPDFDPDHPPAEGLGLAYARLNAPEFARANSLLGTTKPPWNPVHDTLLAALAVHMRVRAQTESLADLAQGPTSPADERWRLVLQVLWGWLDPEERATWLGQALPTQPALAVAVLAANGSAAEVRTWLSAAPCTSLPAESWHRASETLLTLGLETVVADMTPPLAEAAPCPLKLPTVVHQARYWVTGADWASAQPVMVRAWQALRQTQADMGTHLGRLALQAGDVATALGSFQDALALQPQHPHASMGAARALLHLNQPEQALQCLAALQPAPAEAEVWGALALAQCGQTAAAQTRLTAVNPAQVAEAETVGQAAELAERLALPETALAWWQRACTLRSTRVQAWHTLARTYEQQNNREAAQTSVHVALGLHPNHADLRRLAGRLARHNAQWAEALTHYRVLSTLPNVEPTDDWALAECAHALADHELTLTAAQRAAPALANAADQAQAYALAAQAASGLQHGSLAETLWQRAVNLNPQAGAAWLALADMQERLGYPAALATLEAAHHALSQHETAPELTAVRTRLGQAYARAARWDEAQAVLQLAEPNPGTLALLGHVLHQQGYWEAAARALRQAVGAHPHPAPVWHELGLVLEAQGQRAEAVSALQQATLNQPASPAHLDLGRLLLAEHAQHPSLSLPAQAVRALQQAVAAQPERAEAHALLAQALQLSGDTTRALMHHQHAVRLDPANPDWPLALGQAWLAANQPDQAIACLLEAVRQHPHHGAARIWLGQAYAARRLWPEVARVAEEALLLEAHHLEAHVLAARAAQHTGQPTRAAYHWQAALHLRPRDAQLLTDYARAMLDSQQPEAARPALAQALAVSPNHPGVHQHVAGMLRELGEHEAAYTVLGRASQNAAHDPHLWADLGACAMHLSRHAEAHTAWLRVAELRPHAAEPVHQAARALWLAGRAEAALALWERARQRDAQHADTLFHMGMALNQLERYPQALPMLQQALHLGPTPPERLNAGALAALHTGDWVLARQWLEAARAQQAEDPNTALLLSRVARHEGQLEEALAYAQHAAALRPDEPQALAAQALALADLNRHDEARQTLNHALAANPSPLVLQPAWTLAMRWLDWPLAQTIAQHWRDQAPHSAAAVLAWVQAHITQHEWHAWSAAADVPCTAPALEMAALTDTLHHALTLGADIRLTQAWLGRAQAAQSRWDEARATLEPLATLAEPAVGLALARTLRHLHQTTEARALAHQVIEHAPDGWVHTAALLELVHLHLVLHDARGAVVMARRAIHSAPRPLWQALAQYQLGQALWALGETAESQQVLLQAVQTWPVPAWHARYAERSTDPATALAHWHQAYTSQPQVQAWAWAYARALAADGDWAQAVAQYRRLTTLSPDETEAWVERGQAHLNVGDAHAAHECFAQATRLHPEHIMAWVGRTRAHALAQRWPEALEVAQQAVSLQANHPEAVLCLADAHAAQGDWLAARQHYRHATQLTTQPARAWLGVGQTLLATRQWQEAAHALTQAAQADPNCAEVFAALGEALTHLRDQAGALAALTEATQLAPRHAPYWLKLAQACHRLGQLDQALAHLNHALELAPQNHDLWRELGRIFEQRKQFDRALEAYQQAVRLAPRHAQNYVHIGLAYKHLKDYARAVDALERATALEPKNVEAARHLAAVSALHIIYT